MRNLKKKLTQEESGNEKQNEEIQQGISAKNTIYLFLE